MIFLHIYKTLHAYILLQFNDEKYPFEALQRKKKLRLHEEP